MFADVVLDTPLLRPLTYEIPEQFQKDIAIGQRVLVPMGLTRRVGFVVKLYEDVPEEAKDYELKSILAHDTGILHLSSNYWEWLKQGADYYVAPLGMVLSQAIPPAYFDTKKFDEAIVVKTRSEKNDNSPLAQSKQLTSEQNAVVDAIWKKHESFAPTLLQGVTGSGKTEVYIELIKRMRAQGKNVIYLVPEIGLTPQLLKRLSAHFDDLLVNHSGRTPNQRLTQWQSCFDANGRVMVGTRSALFAPFENLGLIIIDEEHDTSYKQDDRFRYHARDLALLRAKLLGIPVVMGSATPSLETYALALQGKYAHERLNKRVTAGSLPEVRVIDVGREREQRKSVLELSLHVHDALERVKNQGEQALVFVGQRGFAQNAYCVSCRKTQLCPNCSVGLKFHKRIHILKCHYCDYQVTFDEICSQCHTKNLTLIGSGAESIENEIRVQHPRMRIERVDSDTMTTAKKLSAVLQDFDARKIDVLVGTQMIAKGHDFAGVTLSVVSGIDAHMGLPDFRSGERAFQTVVQVAGRSGRQGAGLVLVQTFEPDHASVQFAAQQDFDGFAKQELATREMLNYPPFCRLVQLRFLSVHAERLQEFFDRWQPFLLKVAEKSAPHVKIYGPLEMPLAKLRGKHRWHILLKCARNRRVQDFVKFLVEEFQAQKPTGIQLQVDIDPQNLL